jgi:hypothetical protein
MEAPLSRLCPGKFGSRHGSLRIERKTQRWNALGLQSDQSNTIALIKVIVSGDHLW